MGLYLPHMQAKELVKYHHEHGQIVVLARGVFDGPGLHPGHTEFLRSSKVLGGINSILMVNVNNTEWVRMWKRDPLYKDYERAEHVADQEVVDYVFVHPGVDIHPALSLAFSSRPDILTRENKDNDIMKEELRILRNWAAHGYNPKYAPIPRSDYEDSTTNLIERVEKRIVMDVSRETMIKKLGNEMFSTS